MMKREIGAGAFHAQSVADTLDALGTRRDTGLSADEVAERRSSWGKNAIPPAPRRGPLLRLAAQFHNVLIYVLVAAGSITAALGHGVDTVVIFGVVVINAVIGFIQEGRAEDALDAIRTMLSSSARVLRGGARLPVDAEELVPGDIVFLAAGDKVPADLRLLEVRSLRIDESAITGESVPVDKSVDPVAADAQLGDRHDMAYSGTLVTYGRAVGAVCATGMSTELGRISAMVRHERPLNTPLMRQLTGFGRVVTVAILALAVVAFAFGVLIRGYSPGEMFLAAVGLAVAAIPEGLPAVVTITLAIGVKRMATRHAIIRRLPAVEALGSVTVICSDKTGTLTRNEMTVQHVFTADGEIEVGGPGELTTRLGEDGATDVSDMFLRDLARAVLLCNDAVLVRDGERWLLDGDPTEGALLGFGVKAGLDRRFEDEAFPRLDTIPFESEHRYMATLHHDHAGRRFLLLKGAPERVMEFCAVQRRAGDDEALDRARWHAAIKDAAEQGMRVLAVAQRANGGSGDTLTYADVEAAGFTLLGMLAISDPPRAEAIAAVAGCREAGIAVKMITGDHRATAEAIGRRVGLGGPGAVLTGPEIDQLGDDELRRVVGNVSVFARASPEHKLRLVKALQRNGEVVAMTGDGVNDAPALKCADIGVAMGCKGTEAARDASEVVLADDNFASIAAAVEEGRTVYDNLRKAIVFILPTNVGEALIILAAVAAGMALPITPVQILWVNMITAVTLALALAFEPGEADLMQRPPRDPAEPLIDRFLLWRVVFVSLLLLVASFALFLWELGMGATTEVARTAAVNVLVVGEVAYLVSVRRLQQSALAANALPGLGPALIAITVVMLAQLAFTYVAPMQTLFGSAALDAASWSRVTAAGFGIFVAVEAEKWLLARFRRARGAG